MSWVETRRGDHYTVEWEGPPPNYLYHFTTEWGLRAIRRDGILKAGGEGRAGYNVNGDRGVAFTDDPISFNKHHHWVFTDHIRIETSEIFGVRPVVYVGTLTRAAEERYAKSHPTTPVRSLYFALEHEWWADHDILLVKGHYSISLPMRRT